MSIAVYPSWSSKFGFIPFCSIADTALLVWVQGPVSKHSIPSIRRSVSVSPHPVASKGPESLGNTGCELIERLGSPNREIPILMVNYLQANQKGKWYVNRALNAVDPLKQRYFRCHNGAGIPYQENR